MNAGKISRKRYLEDDEVRWLRNDDLIGPKILVCIWYIFFMEHFDDSEQRWDIVHSHVFGLQLVLHNEMM